MLLADQNNRALDLFVKLGNCDSLGNARRRGALGELTRYARRDDALVKLMRVALTNVESGAMCADKEGRQIGNDKMIALFKGIVLIEYFLGWHFLSLSPGISMYQEIEKRCTESQQREAAEWAVRHSENPYIPFGTRVYRSYDEHKWRTSPEGIAEREAHWAEMERRNQERSRIAKQCREQWRRAHDRVRDESQKRHAKDLNEICNISALDGVVHMGNDKNERGGWRFSLAHYPLEWAQITDAELATLPTATLQQIARRARQRAPTNDWRMMAARISSVLNARAT